ncbi:MAG: hypothetical protein JJLCMIEE_02579 [Acidimicrobiales bacterium]|nr:MAG: hypothetical protein EDR02_18490 [Actinomycetota bacterium]MBV6509487.1 hypothetical protein [Acidimicrobiales bacterium]
MQRIIEDYADGRGLHLIASGLNRDNTPSPSPHDPEWNRHRAGGHGKWAKSAIRAILNNPRYTGFEIWNKQRKDEVVIDVEDVALGHITKQRSNDEGEWIWSADPTHEVLVSRELFDAAQAKFTKQGPTTRAPSQGRHYLLSGLLHCGVCGRRMQEPWNLGRAYYRCKFTDDYPAGDVEHPIASM